MKGILRERRRGRERERSFTARQLWGCEKAENLKGRIWETKEVTQGMSTGDPSSEGGNQGRPEKDSCEVGTGGWKPIRKCQVSQWRQQPVISTGKGCWQGQGRADGRRSSDEQRSRHCDVRNSGFSEVWGRKLAWDMFTMHHDVGQRTQQWQTTLSRKRTERVQIKPDF